MSTNPVLADNDYNDYSNNFNRVENFAWTLLEKKKKKIEHEFNPYTLKTKYQVREKSEFRKKTNKLAPCESSD